MNLLTVLTRAFFRQQRPDAPYVSPVVPAGPT
jgi:hypothetical protein